MSNVGEIRLRTKVSLGNQWFKLSSSALLGLMVLCLHLPSGLAQVNSGSISGYVSDPSGAAVPNANVTVTEVRTGIATKGVADSAGLYNITHLLPGEYTVSVEAQGFKRFVQEHVTLRSTSPCGSTAKLELGAITQEVSVTAAPPMLQSEKTDVSKDINQQTGRSASDPAHNLTKLFDIVPGADRELSSDRGRRNSERRDFGYGEWHVVRRQRLHD